jgi:Leucine-rich repeat (LRR) protein
MKVNSTWIAIVFFLTVCAGGPLFAQKSKQVKQAAKPTDPELKQHEQKVKDMVAFLEYVLNTLGNNSTSARDKDVLITESYTKIFRDAKVQVEDDLVEKRNVITNKDVQAYLKDVDFFFDNIKFEFKIKDIQGKVNANDKLFYKVSLIRNIQGMTAEGKAINNTIPRYIEVNYDPNDKDLKIVSIYTNEFNEKTALTNWWKELSFEWQSIFKQKMNVLSDSMQLNDIKNVIALDALDLSGNSYIQDIEPLTQLVDLQHLDLSGTSITDITPLRNLTGLTSLNLSNTNVEDLSALKYSDKLLDLNISNTLVSDISVFEKFVNLEHLEMKNTSVTDFTMLQNLTQLKYLSLENSQILDITPLGSLTMMGELNLSRTGIVNLSPLSAMKSLALLDLDSAKFTDISIMKNLEGLEVLSVNYTTISNLSPLQDLKKLERIYCDHTLVNRDLADAFMASNPEVLVIFDSEDLRGWWNTLPAEWKTVLSGTAKIQINPTKEELAQVTNIDSINVSDNASVLDLEPLKKLPKLRSVVAAKTPIKDLTPLKDHRDIRVLDISNTNVTDISAISHMSKLTLLKADNSDIQNLEALTNLPSLKSVYACLVVYKTSTLEQWWDALPDAWKQVFQTQVPIRPKSRSEDLHRLIELETIHFKDAPVTELTSLGPFVRIKELDFSGTGISDMSPLTTIKSLKSLHATNSPIRVLAPLSSITTLEDLDISNTPVEDLRPIRPLENLKVFNCSGTQVSSLTSLEQLFLESIDFSNTSVKNMDALFGMPLKTLKCYNTRVSSKTVEKFKSSNPSCNVVFYK